MTPYIKPAGTLAEFVEAFKAAFGDEIEAAREAEAHVATTVDGKPTAWVTSCPHCLRELHIVVKDRP